MTANAKDISKSVSVRDEAGTPWDLFHVFDHMAGGFNCDVCANARNHKCPNYIDALMDGFETPWHQRNWCNPPYSSGSILPWIHKATKEARQGRFTYMLLPASIETKWFKELLRVASQILILSPRVNFIPPPGVKYSGNGFVSCVAIIRPGGAPYGGAVMCRFKWKEAVQQMEGKKNESV